MVRKYVGNIELGPDWQELGVIGPVDDCMWHVTAKNEPNPKGWRTVKISADGVAERKANYWVSWNGERIARSREMGAMADHRPELYVLLNELIKGIIP